MNGRISETRHSSLPSHSKGLGILDFGLMISSNSLLDLTTIFFKKNRKLLTDRMTNMNPKSLF